MKSCAVGTGHELLCPAWNQSPGRCGNWYHEEYMEPQKIAEHVVHVDASANGYFMMYLTENGRTVRRGARIYREFSEKNQAKTMHESTAKCGEPAEASDE